MSPIPQQSRSFDDLSEKTFENIVEKAVNAGQQHFLFIPQCFLHYYQRKMSIFLQVAWKYLTLYPHMPILGSSNSAANKDMMPKIWTNGDTIIRMSKKHCGKRRNCSL